MVDAWDPRSGSVRDAVDRLEREYATLSRDTKDTVCYHVVECGTDEEVLELRDWLIEIDMTTPRQRDIGRDPPSVYPTPAVLYHCAVVRQRLDVLRVLLTKESGSVISELLQWAHALPGVFVTSELIDVVKSAPNFQTIHLLLWVARCVDGLQFLQEWFPECLDLSGQEKISKDTHLLVFCAVKHANSAILDALEAQIPGEDFFRNELGEQLLHRACAWRHKRCIERMLEWVPIEFKRLRDGDDKTPLERYMAPHEVYITRTGERQVEEGWVPDPEIVALLTVHTKAAIFS